MGSTSPTTTSPLKALIIGANGYLGSAISRAFLRASNLPTPNFFRVYGLIRRSSSAHALALQETIPIVGSLSSDSPAAVTQAIHAHSRTWDVIVVCTEPSQSDPVAQARHWQNVLALVRGLAEASTSIPSGGGEKAVTPLVLWSSGCKDYGTTKLHGDLELKPHTEWAPLNPPDVVRCRMDGALRALEVAGTENGSAGFDVVVVRASPVYGYSGSYYGAALEYAAAFPTSEKDNGIEAKVLKFTTDANTIMHGVHVDDCADAYVALARTALFDIGNSLDEGSGNGTPKSGRAAIAGQVFNISGRRYETLAEVGASLAAEYGFTGTQFSVSADNMPENVEYQSSEFVFGYSQWVSSEKIRALTGWRDKRPLFSEAIHAYRVAYEAAKDGGSENVETIRKRMMGDWGE
ncbi:MAG: hypothetical protein L6R39_001630 [Caloplaca ligustica]|nr:MAG: hypothetical protein L6R39_001630 [Caloplaca ligustica]